MSNGRYEKELRYEKRATEKLKTLPAVITEYYYHLVGAGSSFTTIDCYINYINSFINYTFKSPIKEDFYKEVTSTDINKFIASLRTKEVSGKVQRTSDSIRALHWSALNSFFQFLIPNYIKSNPVAETRRPKVKDNPDVTYLTSEEIAGIYNKVKNSAKETMVNRDLCIMKLGFSTGLRVSAIIEIDLDDIDFENGRIRVTEKGDRDYYVMIGDNLKQQIILWLNDRKKYFSDCTTNALFISQKRSRLSDDAVNKLMHKYSEGVTSKKVTPHVMRHSCATSLYEKTGDIYLCAKQLNHKNVSTTQRYAEISKQKQREAANILDDIM